MQIGTVEFESIRRLNVLGMLKYMMALHQDNAVIHCNTVIASRCTIV